MNCDDKIFHHADHPVIQRLLCVLVLCATACGPIATASPEGALAAFARALREGDVENAYALTSENYRRRVPREEFERWIAENPSEIRAIVDALSQPLGPPAQEATVQVGERDEVRLVRDPDGWRVASEIVDYYGQRTPAQTLRSFVRAIEHRRWDVVLRLIPEADRE